MFIVWMDCPGVPKSSEGALGMPGKGLVRQIFNSHLRQSFDSI